ncbi:MAG: NHL repeat-containing protein [Candidatus Muirbacterium halophilum]|nr:NHL repeat-containing protein [Candidatus Muirbacterium halophilum]
MKKSIFILILIAVVLISGAAEMEYYFDKSIGKKGKSTGEFDYPVSVTRDSYGNIFVTDWKNSRVQKFSESGDFILEFGNSQAPKLNLPIGIALDNSNNVYVADYGNHRIIKYDENGNLLIAAGKKGKESGEFRAPRGIWYDVVKERLFVADYDNYRIQILDQDLKVLSEIDCKDPDNNKRYPPRSVAVDYDGNVYAVMSSYNVIWKFNTEGKLVRKFGSKGNKPGEFDNPRYIAVDSLNNIYISDYNNDRIQIFNTDGVCKGYFGEKGSGLGHFNKPEGIFIDKEARILIVDAENHRIQVFNSTDIFKYRTLARYYTRINDIEMANTYYNKIYEIDPLDIVAKKIVIDNLIVKLKTAVDDVKIEEIARQILAIDSKEIESRKMLDKLEEKRLKLENKKKIRLIIVLLIILIVVVILILVLKPQKGKKFSDKNIKIIIW